MKTTCRLALLLASMASLLACSDESDQFVILQNQVPKAGCIIGTERNPYRGEGWLDLSLLPTDSPFGYQLYPLLENRLPGVGDQGAEPNRLFMRSFRVNVEPAADAPAKVQQVFGKALPGLLEFEERWSGTVDPDGGLLSSSVTVIPGELARQLAASGGLESVSHASLLVRVRAVAERGTDALASREFRFPVRVCNGCLVRVVACPAKEPSKGHACNLAQDEPVDCCADGNQLSCPATSAAK